MFSSLGLLGLLFPAAGASLPSVEEFFNFGLSSSGFISTYIQLGYALFCFFGGILSDRFAKKNILIIGCIIYAAAGLLLGLSASWILTLVLFFIMGIGCGLIFISSNTLVIDIYREKSSSFLNIHHTFFAFGSLIAPFIVNAFVLRGLGWFVTFRLLGAVALIIVTILFLTGMFSRNFIPQVSNHVTQTKEPIRKKYMRVIRNKTFIMFLVTTLLSVGVQFGIIYLLVSYFVKVRFTTQATAGLILSAFFFFILLGRIVCSYLALRVSAYKIVLTLLILLTVTLVLGWLTTGLFSMIMFALTGLACSGLMPTLLALASSVIETNVRAAALGFLAMAGGLGGMGVTTVISVLSESVGLHNSFIFLIVVSFAALGLFGSVMHKRYNSARTAS
jgi:fucose permease